MALSGSGGMSGGAILAGRAAVELGLNDSGLRAGLDRAAKKLSGFGKSLTKIGLGVSGLGSAGLGAFATTLGRLGELRNLDGVAQAFGLTAEAATGLFGVMAAAGSDTRDATEGLVTLGQRVKDAISGSGEQAANLFRGLKVSAAEFAGLDPAEQFYKLHESLRAVEDPASRVQLLLQAVGEDTGKNLIQTLSLTTEQLREQAKGFSLTGDEMKKASSASAAVAAATAKMDKVWSKLVVAVAPVIEAMANKVGPIFEKVSAIITANADNIGQIATVAATVAPVLIAAGSGLAAFGMIATGVGAGITALSTTVGILTGAVGLIFSPVGVATAAVAGLGVVLSKAFPETTDSILDTVAGGFTSIGETAKTAWGGIVAAVQKGDLAGAGKIALAGLELEWSKFVLWLTKGWVGFKGTFVDSFRDGIAVLKIAFWDFAAFMTRTFSVALRPIIAAAATVSDAVGLDGMAASLRSLDLSDANINRNRDLIQRGIVEDRAAKQQADNQFRQGQLADALNAVNVAQKAFDGSVEGAWDPAWMVTESPSVAELKKQIALVANSSRGQFGGALAEQSLGGGSVLEEQVKKGNRLQEETNHELEGIRKVLERQEFAWRVT